MGFLNLILKDTFIDLDDIRNDLNITKTGLGTNDIAEENG